MKGELQRIVGQNLKQCRIQRGMSQEAFAEFLGVHRTYMGAIECGERNLTLQTVEDLAESVGVSALELLSKPAGSSSRHISNCQ